MIRVLVNGAKGRMGTEVVEAVSGEHDLELAGALDLGDDLSSVISDTGAEVVVDFTVPQCVFENATAILASGARPVIGTTGLSGEQILQLRSQSEKQGLGGVVAPNFAVGAVLLMHYAAQAARYLPSVEIVELHHDKKLDAPSGTSKLTADRIARNRAGHKDFQSSEDGNCFRGGAVSGIRIHSVRLPGLVAHQEVILGGTGQTLSLRHDSLSRKSFMPGVLLAIRKVLQLRTLVEGLEPLLGLETPEGK